MAAVSNALLRAGTAVVRRAGVMQMCAVVGTSIGHHVRATRPQPGGGVRVQMATRAQ